jgi:hypothetical protein
VSGEINIRDSGEYEGISTSPTRLEVVPQIFTLCVHSYTAE